MNRAFRFLFQPYALFLLPWLVGVPLFTLTPINIFSPFRDQFLRLVVLLGTLSALGLIMGLLAGRLLFPTHDPADRALPRLRYANLALLLWLALSAIEVVWAGGIPIATYLLGIPGPASSNFGIPNVHGVAQALFYYCLIAHFLKYMCWKQRRNLIVLILLFLWAVMLFNRGTLIIASLLLFFTYVALVQGGVVQIVRPGRTLLVGLVMTVTLGVAFVVFGNVRGSGNIAELLGIRGAVNNALLWFFVYVVGSGVNLALSMEQQVPVLLHPAFNAATGYVIFVGWAGGVMLSIAFFLSGALCGLLTGRQFPRRLIPMRSVLLFGVVFMFFGHFLLVPAFLLLALLCYVFGVVRRWPKLPEPVV